MPGFVKNHGILGRDALMDLLQQSKVNFSYFLNFPCVLNGLCQVGRAK
jgi:hypothetical protein